MTERRALGAGPHPSTSQPAAGRRTRLAVEPADAETRRTDAAEPSEAPPRSPGRRRLGTGHGPTRHPHRPVQVASSAPPANSTAPSRPAPGHPTARRRVPRTRARAPARPDPTCRTTQLGRLPRAVGPRRRALSARSQLVHRGRGTPRPSNTQPVRTAGFHASAASRRSMAARASGKHHLVAHRAGRGTAARGSDRDAAAVYHGLWDGLLSMAWDHPLNEAEKQAGHSVKRACEPMMVSRRPGRGGVACGRRGIARLAHGIRLSVGRTGVRWDNALADAAGNRPAWAAIMPGGRAVRRSLPDTGSERRPPRADPPGQGFARTGVGEPKEHQPAPSSPSSTSRPAMAKAACEVRLPTLVRRIHSVPRSMVNSISHRSR